MNKLGCVITLLYLPILFIYGMWLESIGISATILDDPSWQWIIGWAFLTSIIWIFNLEEAD